MARGISKCTLAILVVTVYMRCIITRGVQHMHIGEQKFIRCGAQTHDPQIKSLMLYRLNLS